jgi:lipopolysaccharide export system protein LptC
MSVLNMRSLPLMPVSIMLLLLVLTFWLSRYVGTDAQRPRDVGRDDPDVIVEQFTAKKLSPAGDVQYTVTAKRMTHYPAQDASMLDDVVFTSTAPGQPSIVARAPKGRLLSGGDEVVMEGGVVIDADRFGRAPAMQLRTPRLTVLPEKDLASSVDGVVIESVQGVIRAASFELNNATKLLRLTRVEATMTNGKQP